MKINTINSMVNTMKPHFIVIQETQSTQEVALRLHLPGYDFHKNPGQPTSSHTKAKWGVIVAARRHLFNVEWVSLPSSLAGRVVALDVTIPLTSGKGFTHRFMGIYAPWDPGTTDSGNNHFWPVLTELCLSTRTSWSLAGDCNATLFSTESTATPYRITPAQQAYSNFLALTGSIDHWSTIPDHSI
jgi:hypothetical protein